MYCNYFKKLALTGNIIIFTERVSILEDFFDLKKNVISNKNLWKNNNLINLDEFIIIDRVTKKKKNWHTKLQQANTKPKILLINRAFLTLGEKYKDLGIKDIGMIIHDECHNTPSELCYKMLQYFKNLKIPTIGFSATPLRAGKTSKEFNKDRLMTIYGNEDKSELIILSNFNIIYAVEHKLILPPKFVWYEMPIFPIDKEGNADDKKELTKEHVIAIYSVLNKVIHELPYKKIIAWCGTIAFAEKWYEIFKKNRDFDSEFKDFTYCIDHSQLDKKEVYNYTKFRDTPSNAILFCANKHREGSDIPKLDCCIFIDFVKNRSPVPFIQSIGRVLRTDKQDKQRGYVIDSFVSNSECYERELVEKIIGYYMSFENLNETDFETSKYEKYLKIKNMTKFNVKKKQITFKLGNDNVINIDCKKLQWKDIVNKFEPMLQNKIKLSIGDNLKSKANILKNKFNFNVNSDFINEYRNISEEDKIKYNLPNIDDDEYLNIFNSCTWFDILNIKHEFIKTQNEAKRKLIEKNIILDNPVKNWNKWCNIIKNPDLPPFPKYVWGDYDATNFNVITKKTFF
jgi:superfamily II DNA or RNA helicase